MGPGSDRDDDERVVVGLDVGGTKTLAVLVRVVPGAQPQVLRTVRSDSAVAPQMLADLVGSLSGAHAIPSAVGVGLAGYVGLDGVAATSAHVPEVVGVDIGGQLAALCGLPVTVENDGNCAALATVAAHGGAIDDLVAITLGTGIGAGVVTGGRLVRGAHGFAGEPGHMVVDPSGPPCPCGQRGCWERYASGQGLAMLAATAVEAGRMPGSAGAPTGEEVVAAARSGEPGALAVLGEFAAWVALGISHVVNLLDPAVVAIGGGLAEAADMFLPAVRERLEANPTVSHRAMALEVVPWGAGAGAVGAALSTNRV